MNLQDLTDEELDQHRQDVLAEQERRQNLAMIPAQIEELKAKYVSIGGDPGELASEAQ